MLNEVEITIRSKDQSSAGVQGAKRGLNELGEVTDRTATKMSTATGAFGALASGIELSHVRAEQHKQKLNEETSAIDDQISALKDQDKQFKGGNKEIEAQISKLEAEKKAREDQVKAIDDQEKSTQNLSTALMVAGLATDTISGVADIATLAMQSSTLSKVKDIAVTVAHGVAQKAAALATGVWTAAQWLLNVAMDANPVGIIILAIIALIAIIVLIATKTTWFQDIWRAVWNFLKGVGHWFAHDFVDFFKNAWHWIMEHAEKGALWIHDKLQGIVAFVTGLPGKIANAAKGLFNGIVAAAKGGINMVIDAWNRLDLSFSVSIPSWVPVIGGKTFSIPDLIPDIPRLASGGVVKARSGGTLAVLGEGGSDEAIIPLNGASGLGTTITFNGNTDSVFAQAFMMLVRQGAIQLS